MGFKSKDEQREYHRNWLKNLPEEDKKRRLEKQAEWRRKDKEANPDKYRNHYSKFGKKYYEENKEAACAYGSSYVKEDRRKDPKKYLWKGARDRAKQKGLDFNIEVNDIFIPELCPILGFKLESYSRQGGGFNSPSIDRIVPSLGYVKGNIQVISSKANRMKSDATLGELRMFSNWVQTLENVQ